MISGMSALTARLTSARSALLASRRLPAAAAGVAGSLILVVATSPAFPDTVDGLPPFLDTPILNSRGTAPLGISDWLFLLAPVIATALGLCLLRWWPYLLAAAALMTLPRVMNEWNPGGGYPWVPASLLRSVSPLVFAALPSAGYALALVAVLACAQGLIRTAVGWGAAVVALTLGSRLVGSAVLSFDAPYWELPPRAAASWHTVLLAGGVAVLVPVAWRCRRGDPAAAGPAGTRWWQRVRLVVVGALAAAVPIALTILTTQRMADLLGVSWDAIVRHSIAQTAVIGAITVVAVILLAGLGGLWPLAGTVTAAAAQVAVIAPVVLTLSALYKENPLRWVAALAGAALGASIAGSRWRVPLAATLTILAALALFIAYAATTGDPQKLATQLIVIPSVLILVLCAAAASAVVGATAPMMTSRGALPAVLGPLAGTLAVGGMQSIQVTSMSDGETLPSFLNSQLTSATLLLVAGAAIAGLGFAQVLTTRRAERKHAEEIRLEAATAERDRLGRSIHDGVLQVLALVQRQGPGLGTRGDELAALAGEQEAALRGLLAGAASTVGAAARDLCGPLQVLAASDVEVATPAQAVELPDGITAEVVAAVSAALDNVRKHAGADARAWILLEDEPDGVRVTVRDDGIGFPAERLAEAARAGRLGIAQSMRGRIADCGGSTTIDSRPGEGTEVEFWIPRAPRGRR
jgi:signal transduction histidine kinase